MLELIALGLALWATVRIIRYVRMRRYFASQTFLAHKSAVGMVVAEHNEIGQYTAEIRNTGMFNVGRSSTGAQAHLAATQNTSRWNYRRDRNIANFQATNVHNCSLQVARN